MKQFCNIIFLYLSLSICNGYNIIYLNQGAIQGAYNPLGNYWSYFGIPYASFKGRYKEPGIPPKWRGIFIAQRSPLYCTQYSYKYDRVIGEEDCLNLNVYTPRAPHHNNAKPLSVLFFIHGGGFYKGSDTDDMYNPRYLIKNDVVVVNLNYRMGALGFLCLNKSEASGNMGLKDMLAALTWVKYNIAHFGGDPGSVTIFGQSTGASSVDYLVLTQTSTGLFHRAILHSGTSLTIQAFDRNPILTASQAASRLGYTTTDADELMEIFLNATADDLAKISYKKQNNDALAQYIFKPCIEDPNISDTAIITSSPRELLKSVGAISNMSIIVGYNNLEGIFWTINYDDAGLKMLDRDFSSAVPDTFIYKKPEYKENLIADIKEFYFNNSSTSYDGLIDYFSDVLIMAPSIATIEAYLTNPEITMYNYYFSYESMRNLRKIQSLSHFKSKKNGATHTDELFYLFDPKKFRNTCPIPNDKAMIDIMTRLWTNFVKTGVPSYESFEWPRSQNRVKMLSLSREIKVIDAPNKERIKFWKRTCDRYLLDKN